MRSIVRVIGAADGRTPTPHDGKWVIAWNPHTEAGTLELTSTDDRSQATVFNDAEAFKTWRTVSRVQRLRPWDHAPNRPLTAITVEFERV